MRARRYRTYNWILTALLTVLGLSACSKSTVQPVEPVDTNTMIVPMYGVIVTPFEEMPAQE